MAEEAGRHAFKADGNGARVPRIAMSDWTSTLDSESDSEAYPNNK